MDVGTTVNYICVGYSKDEPTNILWNFRNKTLTNDSLVVIYETILVVNNLTVTQSVLELCSVNLEGSGQYSCTANNSMGNSTSNFALDVKVRTLKLIFSPVC